MKQRGSLSLSMILAVILGLIMMTGISVAGVNVVRNIKADDLKMQCDILDQSLETWTSSHKKIIETSIHQDKDGKILYGMERQYPEKLEQLGDLQVYGYIPRSLNYQQFRYTTRDHATSYHLEVDLPDGSVYISPRSSY